MINKNNVPYYIAETLATLTFLASGVFAIAPYIGFLAPVAALSVGLPFIIGCAVFSVVTIALSYKAISKNKTISEKDTQLAEKIEEISKKDAQLAKEEDEVQAQKQTISEKEDQLAEKSTDISNLRDQLDEEKARVQTQKQTISEKEDQLAEKSTDISNLRDQLDEEKARVQTQKQTISEKDALLIEKNKKIEEDKLKVAIADGTVQLANVAVSLTKEAANGTWDLSKYVWNNYVPSTESAKEKLSNAFDAVGNGLRNTYSVMPSVEFAKDINKTASQKAFASVNEAYSSGRVPGIVKCGLTDVYYPPILANGGFDVASNSSSAVGNHVNGTKSNIPISTSICPELSIQCQIDGYSNTLVKAQEIYGNSPKESSLSNEGVFSGTYNKVSSVVSSLWNSFSSLISGSNKDAHNHSEPQWYKELHRSEDLEEIIDDGVLDNLFPSRVDNGINTSKQQGTFIDSVELKKLTKALPPLAYHNGSPRIL